MKPIIAQVFRKFPATAIALQILIWSSSAICDQVVTCLQDCHHFEGECMNAANDCSIDRDNCMSGCAEKNPFPTSHTASFLRALSRWDERKNQMCMRPCVQAHKDCMKACPSNTFATGLNVCFGKCGRPVPGSIRSLGSRKSWSANALCMRACLKDWFLVQWPAVESVRQCISNNDVHFGTCVTECESGFPGWNGGFCNAWCFAREAYPFCNPAQRGLCSGGSLGEEDYDLRNCMPKDSDSIACPAHCYQELMKCGDGQRFWSCRCKFQLSGICTYMPDTGAFGQYLPDYPGRCDKPPVLQALSETKFVSLSRCVDHCEAQAAKCPCGCRQVTQCKLKADVCYSSCLGMPLTESIHRNFVPRFACHSFTQNLPECSSCLPSMADEFVDSNTFEHQDAVRKLFPPWEPVDRIEAKDLVWVSIPSGTFQMGARDWSDSQPVHSVAVPSFQMSKTEVTVSQYQSCVNAGTCTAPTNPNCRQSWDDAPVVCVDWDQSKTFCSWAGGRLCSEAEWEYAARNGSAGNRYPWGDTDPTWDDAVWLTGSSIARSGPEAGCSKSAGNNTWGVCDLAGNVAEWVEDDFHRGYTGAPSDGSAWVNSPRASSRVDRGGDFRGERAAFLRGSFRQASDPSDAGHRLGSRCCRTQ